VSKDGAAATPALEDILVDRCYFHTFKAQGAHLNFGLTRLHMRDTRILGRINSENHTTHNALFGGSNWRDCVFENCLFGNVSRIGFEATLAGYEYAHERTRLHGCRAEECGSMGFSAGFGEGIVFEKCKAKNVVQFGFELAGRAPGFPGPPPDPSNRYGQGIIESCEVDGVTYTGPAAGFSLDGARDSLVRGATRISNVSTTLTDGACGIGLSACERCSIREAVLDNTGHYFLYITKGYSPNTGGFHEVIGNAFRNASGTGATHKAIYVDNQSAAVRGNTAYQKSGTTFGFACNTSAPAQVNVDGTPVAYGAQSFGGTNQIVPC
jgi:hypothetical protein